MVFKKKFNCDFNVFTYCNILEIYKFNLKPQYLQVILYLFMFTT